jgi:diguanylate cyclase (GGDEF)-like protein
MLLILYFSAHAVLNNLEKYWNRSTVISFELPFPADVEDRYYLKGKSSGLNIESVVLSGFFSGWNPDDANYLMEKVSDTKWQISVRFPPGENQYKFAVHARAEDPDDPSALYWVYDKTSETKVGDSYGGYNSSYSVYRADSARLYLNILFAGSFMVLLLFFVLNPLFRRMLNFKMKFRFKIVFSALVFGLITNLFFIALNVSQQRELARLMILESVNMIHLLLGSEGVDFKQMGADSSLISDVLNSVLVKGMGRNSARYQSNAGIMLDSVTVFDTDFNVAGYSYRQENEAVVRNRMQQNHSDDFESYFRSVVFIDSIVDLRAHQRFGNVVYEDVWFPDHSFRFKRNAFFLGFSQFLQPIYVNTRIVGYYGVEVNVNLFGSKIMYNFLVCLILLPLCILFYIVIFSAAGKWITGHLVTLLSYTEKIKEGDFSSQDIIRSGDEIEMLSGNFDAMRERLKGQIEEINAKNRNLSDMTESLESIVAMRTSELKETLVKLEESNVKLEQISITDSLTGIFNRRHFDSLIDVALRKAFREQAPFSVIMADIDDFKRINDTYGHPAGDEVLISFARCILNSTRRPGDVVARYGGEEFILFLENTNDEGCALVAEKIRHAVENLSVLDGRIRLTASFGIFSSVPVQGMTSEGFIKLADDGLYKAKKSGKNRVSSVHSGV